MQSIPHDEIDGHAFAFPIAHRAPNQNAFVERWVQSIKHECLDHFIVFGEDHYNHLISEYVEHYSTERPHQGLDNGLVIATHFRWSVKTCRKMNCSVGAVWAAF